MDILESIKRAFRHGNAINQLIIINSIVFLLVNLVTIAFTLFNFQSNFILPYLALPAQFSVLLTRFWTPISYMFLHQNFFHILFNMLTLFWFGKIFLLFFTEKQLVGLYVTGGLIAALFYVISFNVFPYYSSVLPVSILLGASGSVMAIIVASAMRSPNMQMQLLLLGAVKLKYIALAAVLMSVFGVTSSNGGGELAHLGGALAGYLFVVSLPQGKDITAGINSIINVIINLFAPKKLKVKPNNTKRQAPMNDADFNAFKAKKEANINQILDKIKTSGYESLSSEEKKQLFDQGNKK